MTVGTGAGDLITCRQCSFRSRPGDQFCERCGAPIGLPLAQRDATTRYLCAAAHLDAAYSDAAITEFLVEPVRAIPPAPGVDSAAVLRDAVAARARRRIRDAVLLSLLVILAFTSPSALVIWLVVALVVSGIISMGAASERRNAGTLLSAAVNEGVAHGQRNAVILLIVAGSVVLVLVLLPQLPLIVGYSAGSRSSGAGLLPGVLVGLVALAVIGVDTFTVHHMVYTSFRRGRFVPDARRAHSGWEGAVRTLGHASFQTSLARVAAADERAMQNPDQADVVVHRGFSPFIGSGVPINREIIALALEPSEQEDADEKPGGNARPQPRRISVVELHQHVATAINELRSSSSLGPGRRLAGLTQREQVLMAADRLVTNLDTQPRPAVLPDLSHAPAARMPTAAARNLADSPQEWARYYRCFRIETWDRDLTMSCYLHAGTDQRMLFLEWTFCVLLPIRAYYREIDQFRSPFLTPLNRSLLELVVLPATVVRRLRSVFRRFVPLVQRDGEVVPAKYGAGKSLREIAADVNVQSYFQDVDVERHVKIVDSTLFRSVGKYLDERGYSVVEFQRLADRTVNTLSISGGTFLGSAVGFGNTARGNNNQSAPSNGGR